MKCPNCDKSYHWCGNCGWEAGLYACSYECARELWDNDKLDDSGMLECALEEISMLNDRIIKMECNLQSRAANTIRSAAKYE